jgi:nucleoside-diphosphate-sugar epimerase
MALPKILVTGATGFVGSALVRQLTTEHSINAIVVAVRRANISWPEGVRSVQVGELLPITDWGLALKNINVVVHCAARVHVMQDGATDPLEEYRRVNVLGTLNLARQAVDAGVRRFIFVSSIKVNGESTTLGQPFTADDAPCPVDPYGISKQEAEQALLALSIQTGMEVVIIRPPLVYGAGVKANFATMMRWVAYGIPLPFGGIQNARSMVALDNLVNLLIRCIDHPAAAGQIFLVSDGEDVSTTELLRRTAQAMNKKIILLPIPSSWLICIANVLGKQSVAQRLCGSLQVDIEKTCKLLNWKPPLSLEQGLSVAVRG